LKTVISRKWHCVQSIFLDQYRVDEASPTQIDIAKISLTHHSSTGVIPTTWMIDSQIIYSLYLSCTIYVTISINLFLFLLFPLGAQGIRETLRFTSVS
jgi:hypothetical protein